MSEHGRLPGRLTSGAQIADRPQRWPVVVSEDVHRSGYLDLVLETIRDPAGEDHQRAVVRPNGSVGVLAVDEHERVLLIEQYRHPVGRRMIELPAGTLDVTGEAPEQAARRELAEEADLRADQWSEFISGRPSPGYSSEGWTIFRATGLSPVPAAERTERTAEEAGIVVHWVPLSEAVGAALAGRITDAKTIIGLLAEQATSS